MNTAIKPVEKPLSEESAQAILDQFTEYYELDIEDLPDTLKQAMTYCLNHLKRAIRKGRLEIEVTDDTITITQNLKRELPGVGMKLVYKEIDGASKLVMKDDASKDTRLHAWLGALSKEGAIAIGKLRGADMSLAESLGTVFLQV